MREFFRDVMIFVGVCFAGISAYYQSHPPTPTDPPAVQTVASHPIAGLIVVALLFIIAGVLNSTPLLSRLLPKKKPDVAREAADPLPLPFSPPDALCEALKEIANTDAEKISERVQEIGQRIEFHFAPGSEPFIDVITDLWNGSVFGLVNFGEISGHVTYGARQLAADPRIIVSVEPVLLSLKHGGKVTLVVRQYLSAEIADRMEANRNRQIAIDFRNVAVPFRSTPLPGFSQQSFRWIGPRFGIE